MCVMTSHGTVRMAGAVPRCVLTHHEKKGVIRIARRCKCQITGEQGTTDTFYRAANGKYYKTKEIYDEHMEQIATLKKVKKILYEDFFGYSPEQPRSTWGFSELAQLTKFYDASTVLRTIEKKYDAIRYSIKHKKFKNEHAMMKYVFAIIKNNIKAVYEQEQRRKETSMPVREPEIMEDDHEESQTDLHAGAAKDLTGFIHDEE